MTIGKFARSTAFPKSLLILVLGAGGLWTVQSGGVTVLASSAALPGLLADYQRAGLPLFADQVIQPRVADSQNAAPLLTDAWKPVDTRRLSTDLAAISLLCTAHRYGDAGQRLKAYRRCFDMVSDACRRTGLDFHRPWDQGVELQFSEPWLATATAKLMLRKAEVLSAQGQSRRAGDLILEARRLGALIGQDPGLQGLNARLAIELDSCRTCLRCARLLCVKRDKAVPIAAAMEAPLPALSIATALRGEAYEEVTSAILASSHNTLALARDMQPRAQLSTMLRKWIDIEARLGGAEEIPESWGSRKPPSSLELVSPRLGASIVRLLDLRHRVCAALRTGAGSASGTGPVLR